MPKFCCLPFSAQTQINDHLMWSAWTTSSTSWQRSCARQMKTFIAFKGMERYHTHHEFFRQHGKHFRRWNFTTKFFYLPWGHGTYYLHINWIKFHFVKERRLNTCVITFAQRISELFNLWNVKSAEFLRHPSGLQCRSFEEEDATAKREPGKRSFAHAHRALLNTHTFKTSKKNILKSISSFYSFE